MFLGGATAAGLGAASIGLVGCGDDNNSSKTPGGSTPSGSASAKPSSSASAAPSATPKPGGSYTPAFTGPFAGVDPHNSVYGGAGIVPEVYNYLVRDYIAFAPEKGIIQDLAESQTLQDDKVTWVFKIRPNVMITANTKGVPERALDSSDVLASWERIKDPKSGSNGYAFANQWIDKLAAPDASTFTMTMKSPYAWTIANVGNNLIGAIVPKEWLANADLKKGAVGAGPFKLTELVEGDHATMDKNPTYYKKGKPYLDKHIIRTFADLATERTAFTSGQIDAYPATNQDEAKEIVNGNKQIQYKHDKSISYNSFWMSTKSAPWSDGRVRDAVNMAINRDQYIQLIGHGAGEPIGPITYAFEKYALSKDDLSKAQPYDPAEAKKLFQAAGVTEFTFSHPTSSNVSDYVNIFVKNMQDAGVTAKPQPLDAGTWVAGYYTNKLTASLSLNQQYQTPDFALQWYVTGGITGNNHYDTGYSVPEVDAAVKKAAGILDDAEREQSYKDVQKLILKSHPPFVNFFGLYVDQLVAPYIHNYPFGIGSLGYAFIEDVWTDKA
jgi:ABC-type transport system substrate-binding protein